MRILFMSILILTAAAALPDERESINPFLRRFHANPLLEMERLPARWDEAGETAASSYIDPGKVGEAMPFRAEVRDLIVGPQAWPSIDIGDGSPDGKDFAEKLVDGGAVLGNLRDMEARGLERASLRTIPWPDSYWPFYRGVISNRYADPEYPRSDDWAANYQYIRMRPAATVIASGDSAAIDALAPAEKYDFALGDWSFALTNHGWLQGERQMEKYGLVAKWMGICHGWSAAAHMLMPIPAAPVTVIAASGQAVVFYPQDIKALQSMLWANASPSTKFVGNRCNVHRPQRNGNGRILDPKCFDSNPGTWHMIAVNQLGIHQRSFVMDSSFDLEVWNFAVASYHYRYFNPETWREGANLESSLVPLSRYRVDKFREFRSAKARYVAGIFMDVQYVNAIAPTRNPNVKPPLKTIRYVYDLELDENMNIVGGEWYSNAHPDFLWTFDPGAQAMTAADRALIDEGWEITQPVPLSWAEEARRASGGGKPLFSFIRGITNAPPAALE